MRSNIGGFVQATNESSSVLSFVVTTAPSRAVLIYLERETPQLRYGVARETTNLEREKTATSETYGRRKNYRRENF